MDKACCRNKTKVQQGIFAGNHRCLFNTIQLPAIHRKVGLDSKTKRTPFFLLTCYPVHLLSPGFGHFHQMMQVFRIGIVAEIKTGKGTNLQVFLVRW